MNLLIVDSLIVLYRDSYNYFFDRVIIKMYDATYENAKLKSHIILNGDIAHLVFHVRLLNRINVSVISDNVHPERRMRARYIYSREGKS